MISQLTKKLIRGTEFLFYKKGVSEPENSCKFILLKSFGFKLSMHRYFFKFYVKSPKLNKILYRKEIRNKFYFLVSKRLNHYPIQYILGEWFFRDLIVKCRPPVLIPRPETERLIDLAKNLFENYQMKNKATSDFSFMEIGVGTGIIFISLLRELKVKIKCVGIDLDPKCVNLSKENASRLVPKHKQIDLQILDDSFENYMSSLSKVNMFDFIVSNPPYIKEEADNVMVDVVKYESQKALFSGKDGLDLIRLIIINSRKLVKKGGFVILEIDPDQKDEIFKLLIKEKYTNFLFENDIFQRCRFVYYHIN